MLRRNISMWNERSHFAVFLRLGIDTATGLANAASGWLGFEGFSPGGAT
jgi:hypothetical protein